MTKLAITSIATVVIMAVAVVVIILIVPTKNTSITNRAKISNSHKALAPPLQQKPTPAVETANAKLIESNVKTFFAADTTTQQRESLLQNGAQFAQVIKTGFMQLNSDMPSVVINSVSFPSSKLADVNFTVDLKGQAVLKNQSGQALLINNSWEVSDSTLCSLISTIGQTPSVCYNIH